MNDAPESKLSPWMLRFKIDNDEAIFDEHFEFKRDIVDLIDATWNSDEKAVEIVSSPDTFAT